MGHLSVKLDVYSFGVLVLEIVTGRRNTDACFESEVDEGSSTMLSYVSSRPSLPLILKRNTTRSWEQRYGLHSNCRKSPIFNLKLQTG